MREERLKELGQFLRTSLGQDLILELATMAAEAKDRIVTCDFTTEEGIRQALERKGRWQGLSLATEQLKEIANVSE